MDILFYCGISIICIYIVISVIFTTTVVYRAYQAIKKEQKSSKITNIASAILKNSKFVYIDAVHNNGNITYCAYDSLTNKFVCQDITKEAVFTQVKELFPKKFCVVTDPPVSL